MQNQDSAVVSKNERIPKIERIETKNRVRRGCVVLVLFLTVLFLILSLSTRVRVKEDRTYSTKNEVALYLFTYKKLPSNYILKSSVPKSQQGKQPENGQYFGGDVFYYSGAIKNYTERTDLRECDLTYPKSTTARGTYRLVYSADCSEVFYSWTHYGNSGEPAFVKVTKWGINAASNTFLILFTVFTIGGTCYVGFVFIKKKDDENRDLRAGIVLFGKIIGFALFILPCIIFFSPFELVSKFLKKLRAQQ